MTKDLEETLEELGAGYAPVVERLRAAFPCAEPSAVPFPRARARRRSAAPLLAAAGFAAAFVVAAVVSRGPEREEKIFTARAGGAAREYRLAVERDGAAVEEMIRTQRPDGSWANEFLTRQNAAALALCSGEEARIAYRKAMRNIRFRDAAKFRAL